MRFFAEIAYDGTPFHGWQRQPNALSVQQAVEEALQLILRQSIPIVGCGRTDTGVHASAYFFHFDFQGNFPPRFVDRLNKVLPAEIGCYRIFQVTDDAHARFDATRRAYTYHLHYRKQPHRRSFSYFYRPAYQTLSPSLLQEAAALLLEYNTFFPFCKSDHDANTLECTLFQSEWIHFPEDYRWEYHIAANRFLRGMVRLIVGMCLQVGMGKLPLSEVRQAMERQQRLRKSESAPPEGLFLTEVRYSELLFNCDRAIGEDGIWRLSDGPA